MALTIGELRVLFGADTTGLRKGTKQGRDELGRFTKKANTSTQSVQRGFSSLGSFIRGTFLPILGALGAALSVREFVVLSEAATEIRNRLRLVTDSAEELNTAFGTVREIANATRVPLQTTANLFVRLTKATEELGLSEQRIADLTETVNQTLALSGASAEQARNGLLQFGQGLAGGILRAEEFNSIIENTPGLADELAKGFGVGIGRLRQLVIAGEVTSERIVEALEGRAPAIAEQFAGLSSTISQAFSNIRTELLVFADGVNQASGASALFSGTVLEASDGLADNLAAGIRVTLQNLSVLVEGLAEVTDSLENVGITAGGLQEVFRLVLDIVNVAVQGIQTGFRSIQTGIAALAAGVQSVGNVFGVVTDEAFAEGIADFEKAQKSLIDSSFETEAALEKLLAGFVEIDSKASEGIDTRLSDSIRQTAKNIASSAGSVEESLERLRNSRAKLNQEAESAGAAQAALTKEQETTLTRLLKVEQQINLERLRGVSPLLAQRQQLENQIQELQEIVGPLAVVEARDSAIAALRRQQLLLTEEQNSVLEQTPIILDDIERRLTELEILDPAGAERLRQQVDAAISGGIGTEEQLERLRQSGRAVSEALIEAQDAATLTIGEGFQAGLEGAIDNALRGDFGGALAAFGAGLEQAATESLSKAFTQSAQQLGDLLDSILPDSLGGLGLPLTGILGAAIGAALQDDEISTSVGNVQSAVTSAQQVRGVVAGPTNIAVADVGRSIQDALLESERLLGIIALNTGRLVSSGTGEDFNPGDEASLTLASESASLI